MTKGSTQIKNTQLRTRIKKNPTPPFLPEAACPLAL
jgi:hypothetical protein